MTGKQPQKIYVIFSKNCTIKRPVKGLTAAWGCSSSGRACWRVNSPKKYM
ncbi:MAG: hypothetical protein RR219_01790 [Clostridiales bacterium]